jgi:hypothetical protein
LALSRERGREAGAHIRLFSITLVLYWFILALDHETAVRLLWLRSLEYIRIIQIDKVVRLLILLNHLLLVVLGLDDTILVLLIQLILHGNLIDLPLLASPVHGCFCLCIPWDMLNLLFFTWIRGVLVEEVIHRCIQSILSIMDDLLPQIDLLGVVCLILYLFTLDVSVIFSHSHLAWINNLILILGVAMRDDLDMQVSILILQVEEALYWWEANLVLLLGREVVFLIDFGVQCLIDLLFFHNNLLAIHLLLDLGLLLDLVLQLESLLCETELTRPTHFHMFVSSLHVIALVVEISKIVSLLVCGLSKCVLIEIIAEL